MMIRKHIKGMVLAVVALLTLTACPDENAELEATPSRDYIKARDLVIPGNATEATLAVDANCSWSVQATDAWLSVNPSQGTGSRDITVTTTQNPSSAAERTSTVTITSQDGIRKIVKVTQQKNEEAISLSDSQLTFGANDETPRPVTVTSNSHWTVTGIPTAGWLRVSPAEGGDEARQVQVEVSVEVNPQETAREATLTFTADGGAQATLHVTQTGRVVDFSVSPPHIAARAVAGTYSFLVTATTDWRVSSVSESWVGELSVLRGSADATVSFSCEDNTTLAERTAVITVSTDNYSETVTVTQAAGEQAVVGSLLLADMDYETDSQSRLTATLESVLKETMFAVTEYGICYGLSANPTTADEKVRVMGSLAVDQRFSMTLTGLAKEATYHARAYVVTAVGTAYGDDLEFVALPKPKNGDNDRSQTSRRQ